MQEACQAFELLERLHFGTAIAKVAVTNCLSIRTLATPSHFNRL